MAISRRVLLGCIAGYVGFVFTELCAQSSSTNQTLAPASQPMKGLPFPSPFQPIEDAASLMTPDDSSSVRTLVDMLFKFPMMFPMPDMMATVVKQRLIDAQKAYLNGKASGTIDGGVVDALDGLANEFDAPDSARTSLLQVRFLRNRLAVQMPVFMGSAPDPKADEPNPPLSPAQAMFLMSWLITQKSANPDYQVAPAEWDRDYYPRLQEQARKADELRRKVEAGEAKYEVKASLKVGTTTTNSYVLILRRIRQMSVVDGLKVFNDTFARLGIS